MGGPACDHVVALGEVHRAAVQRGDLGQELLHVREPHILTRSSWAVVTFAVFALLHGPRSEGHDSVPLWAPRGATQVFRDTVAAWGEEKLIESAFALREYAPDSAPELGPLRARFQEVPHFTRTFAVELCAGRQRFTFGADCGPNEGLVAFARDTDLLLIEATQLEPDSAGDRGHLTAREAGEHGRRAGARRLVLTHYSDELDEGRVRTEATDGFGAPVELATAGAVYEL